MIMSIHVSNLDALRSNFERAPSLALSYLAKATQAAIFEVEKQAIDPNFRFKTPRAKRTGYLSLSFSYGRYIDPSGLRAAIGPTAFYAPYVEYGTRRGIQPNPYMERIAKAAKPGVEKQFETAIGSFVAELARV
jgi:hypothetical protein